MNRKELINGLIAHGVLFAGEHPSGIKGNCSLLRWLARNGFAASEHGYVYATAATPLALLTPTQIDCAEWLVDERQVAFRDAEPFQRRRVAAMVKEGLVNEGMWSWKPTPKLIEAVKCWREARESNR